MVELLGVKESFDQICSEYIFDCPEVVKYQSFEYKHPDTGDMQVLVPAKLEGRILTAYPFVDVRFPVPVFEGKVGDCLRSMNIKELSCNNEDAYWTMFFDGRTVADLVIYLRRFLPFRGSLVTFSVQGLRAMDLDLSLLKSDKNKSFEQLFINNYKSQQLRFNQNIPTNIITPSEVTVRSVMMEGEESQTTVFGVEALGSASMTKFLTDDRGKGMLMWDWQNEYYRLKAMGRWFELEGLPSELVIGDVLVLDEVAFVCYETHSYRDGFRPNRHKFILVD